MLSPYGRDPAGDLLRQTRALIVGAATPKLLPIEYSSDPKDNRIERRRFPRHPMVPIALFATAVLLLMLEVGEHRSEHERDRLTSQSEVHVGANTDRRERSRSFGICCRSGGPCFCRPILARLIFASHDAQTGELRT